MTDISINDCIQGSIIGKGTVSGSQITLKHTGDAVTLICPATMSQVTFHIVKLIESHDADLLLGGQKYTDNPISDLTLKTGETHTVGPVKEQYLVVEQQFFGIAMQGRYIDNMDITITIGSALDIAGKPPDVNPEGFVYNWSCTDSDDKILASGTAASLQAARDEIDTYIKEHMNDNFTCLITDAYGNVQWTHQHTPPGGDYDWVPWVIGGIIIIVIAALVYWYFLRGRTVFGHKFGPKAPARPPASAPAVAAPAAPAPAPAPAPAAPEVK